MINQIRPLTALPRFKSLWRIKGQLVRAVHPKAAAYAFVLVLIGFNFYPNIHARFALATATAFALMASSIMGAKTIIERQNDMERNRVFTVMHAPELFWFWASISSLCLATIIRVWYSSRATALFCLGVWAMGLSYAYLRQMFFLNNFVMAACFALPILAAAVPHWRARMDQWLVAVALCLLVFIKEIYSDIHDRIIDRGYKLTFSSYNARAYKSASMFVFLLLALLFALLLFCSHTAFRWLTPVVLILGVANYDVFQNPDHAAKARVYIDATICLLMAATIISQFV
ncbi:MAG TPA: UbiA family prenyltransferase [Patescibacteria group bacterium]|jgi:hypothetical protein|nr:UbiA family prenyltransferase [Patescibacteria group bacterium]